MNQKKLFLASCMALIATSMSFAIRGDIMGDFESIFELSKSDIGWISGAAFWGFGLSIIIGGPLCDVLGMKNIMRLAGLGHVIGTFLTIFSTGFTGLFIATLVYGIANGLVEAAINPLIATLYKDQKSKMLTILHAWFPGGIVIGGLACMALNSAGYNMGSEMGWKIKMALLLIPSIIYIVMIMGEEFPPSERAASGVPFGDMFKECLTRPLFWVVFVVMWFTASTELGPGQWIANIYNDVMESESGIMLLVWGTGTMFLLRQFGSGVAHKMFSPVALIAATAPLAVIGLWMITYAETPLMWFVSITILNVGFCFWWPTMLGITAERLPKSGVVGLGIIGGAGSISTAISGPVMGMLNENFSPKQVLPIWSALPVAIIIIFGIVYFKDKANGGYKAELLDGEAPAESH
jgi:MFS family permease